MKPRASRGPKATKCWNGAAAGFGKVNARRKKIYWKLLHGVPLVQKFPRHILHLLLE